MGAGQIVVYELSRASNLVKIFDFSNMKFFNLWQPLPVVNFTGID